MRALGNVLYALRTLRQSPALTVAVLLTLALGIGANTAIFTVVYATLLAPLPYPHPDQLVMVWSKAQGRSRGFVSAADFADWKQRNTVFQGLNAWSTDNFNIATRDRPEFLDGFEATPGYSAMFGNAFLLGRDFLPEEGQIGKDHVVILTHRLWQHLGADLTIIGRNLRINGQPYSVVGVLASGTADRWDPELIVPLAFKPSQLAHGSGDFVVVGGRLKPGVSMQQAQAGMNSIAAQSARDYPNSNRGLGVLIEPLKNDFFPSDRRLTLWLLFGAVGFLLLIACLNVANLLLAKGITRHREIAIRGALGATPGAIFGQFLTESLVLAIPGGLLGVLAGYAMLRGLLLAMPPHTLPLESDPRLNVPMLLFTLASATLAGVFFGCAPAWHASRLKPSEVLKDGGRAGTGVRRHRLGRILVVAEFAVTLPLLAGAGLTIHSFWNLTRVDLGVRTDHIVGFYLDSPSVPQGREQINSYYRNILSSVGAVPGVIGVTAMMHLPLDSLYYATRFSIAGRAEDAEPASRPSADFQTPTPGYFQTFGIRIAKGRAFTDADNEHSLRVAMVNEAFASRFLQGFDPLEQRLRIEEGPDPAVEWQIVGVFHTVKSREARADFPQIAVPFWQMGPDVAGIGVRTGEDPASMIKTIAGAVNAVDSQAALALTRTMDQVHDEALANDRFTLILFSGFAFFALLLAAVGIYGVMAFSVTQRAHEIALRMALGATRHRVVAMVVKEGAGLACAGLVFGWIGAYFVERAMRGTLFGVGAIDLPALVPVGLVLFVAALLACYWPARKASSIEIIQAMQGE